MGIKIVQQASAERGLRQLVQRNLERQRSINVGVMVSIDGSDDPSVAGRPGYVWVREYSQSSDDFGGVVPVFNSAVEKRVDVPVFIGSSPKEPWRRIVLGVDWSVMAANVDYSGWSFDTSAHAPSHVFQPGKPDAAYGTDVVNITERNLGSGRVYATDPLSMKCVVSPVSYIYRTYVQFFQGGLTEDFSVAGQVPGAAGLARLAFICVDGATNVLAYEYTDTFPWADYGDPISALVYHIPITEGYVVLSTVLLYFGMTEINERCFSYEMRPLFEAVDNFSATEDSLVVATDGAGDLIDVIANDGGVLVRVYADIP